MDRKDKLTPREASLAKTAGVPVDRPGLGDEYPKMLYRPGDNPAHHHLEEPLLMQGKYKCETLIVDDATEEDAALVEGWSKTPSDEPAPPRRGRPPKAEEADA